MAEFMSLDQDTIKQLKDENEVIKMGGYEENRIREVRIND